MTADEYANYFDEALPVYDRTLLYGRLGGALAFLIPALQFVQFNVIGTLYASDLLSLAVVFLAGIPNAQLLNRRLPRRFLGFGLLWLLAQIISDLLRDTPFDDYARGWAMIAFALVNFAALYLLLYQNRRRIILCTFGFVTGGILTYLLSPNVFAAAEPWKFGYGYPVTLFIVLVAVFLNQRQRRMLAVALMMFAAALNLYEGFRSLAGECFAIAAYLLLMGLMSRRSGRSTQASPVQALVACTVLALSSAGLFHVYAYCADNGLLGYAAWQKYEIQSSGRYGILVGGRGEFFTGLEAVRDSPIVGHGSWAKDWHYASRQEALMTDLGYKAGGPPDSWLIPTHSYLIGAWVNAGIIGALFWLWVLSLPMRVLARLHTTDKPIAPLIGFLAIGLIWDVIFSPFGAAQRFSMSFAVVTLIWFFDAYPEFGELIP